MSCVTSVLLTKASMVYWQKETTTIEWYRFHTGEQRPTSSWIC